MRRNLSVPESCEAAKVRCVQATASGVKTSRLRSTALPLTKFEYQRFSPRAADGDLEHELIADERDRLTGRRSRCKVPGRRADGAALSARRYTISRPTGRGAAGPPAGECRVVGWEAWRLMFRPLRSTGTYGIHLSYFGKPPTSRDPRLTHNGCALHRRKPERTTPAALVPRPDLRITSLGPALATKSRTSGPT